MHMQFGGRESHVRSFAMVEIGSLRRRMQRAIDDLIAALDALDGDADFESANDDEPSLGWPGDGRGAAGRLDGPAFDAGDDDRELDAADDEDGHDRELCCEDEGEDGGDRESDMAEYGVADEDALLDPTLDIGMLGAAFDGLGRAIARDLLQNRRIAP